ncbi:MAG: hypothetical protein ACP5OA_07230 [Candidatus Woesearchaeota archaeon]
MKPIKNDVHPKVSPAPTIKNAVKTEAVTSQKKIRSGYEKKSAKEKSNVIDLPLEGSVYFVYLKNPLNYRRQLLESSMTILLCLRGYQKILLIRQQKLHEMSRLKSAIKELTYLNKKFNENLPKYSTAFLENKAEENKVPKIAKHPSPKVSVQIPAETKDKTEIEKLEETLAGIEQKLKNLK